MRLESVADPALQPGDMLLQMKSAAVCGTDIRIYRGRKTRGVRLPSIPGHEFTGDIVDTGGHAIWRTGDRVAVCPAEPAANAWRASRISVPSSLLLAMNWMAALPN